MEFAGIIDDGDRGMEGQYKGALPEGLGVRTRWPEEAYVDALMKAQEEMRKKMETEGKGKPRAFISEGVVKQESGNGVKRSRFDDRSRRRSRSPG